MKTREELQTMKFAELRQYAEQLGMEKPWPRKAELIDEVVIVQEEMEATAGEPENMTKLNPDAPAENKEGHEAVEDETGDEQTPTHIIEHKRRIAALEKEVAERALAWGYAQAANKKAKKDFEEAVGQLAEAVNTKPQPGLFDGADDQPRVCRKCGVAEGTVGVYFAGSDLCRDCADHLGQDKAKQELAEKCRHCGGTAWDKELDVPCGECEGTGKALPRALAGG